jgi:hypothetical protein
MVMRSLNSAFDELRRDKVGMRKSELKEEDRSLNAAFDELRRDKVGIERREQKYEVGMRNYPSVTFILRLYRSEDQK